MHDTPSNYELLQSALVVLASLALHWSLTRLAKRLPRWSAQRRGGSPTITELEHREHLLVLALAPVKLVLWVACALFVANRFAAFRAWRAMVLDMLQMALASTLFEIDGRVYSTTDIIELPFALLAVWLVVAALSYLLHNQVLAYTGMNRGAQETVAKLTRYSLAALASLVVLQLWGFDVRTLALTFSVLGVGIGFGLQNIANNFVSGLVINFERPVQPDDFVKIGDLCGTVERIGARSTSIRTLDRVTILVPNSRLLEHEVINWTHGDPVSRLHVPVAVAYASDLRLVRATLLDVASRHSDVLKDPRPRVELRRFGDSCLEFELLVWTSDPRSQARLISDLNYRIVTALRRAAIEIPFPQRDLHLRSPQLEHLLNAWGRRTFEPGELRSVPPALAPQGMGNLLEEDAEDSGPEAWNDVHVQAVAARMRGHGGIVIADRRHLLKVYPRCFVGHEAVLWLMQHEDLTRGEAIALGETMIRRGILHHVLDEHGFKDGSFFYRFRADEASAAA